MGLRVRQTVAGQNYKLKSVESHNAQVGWFVMLESQMKT